MHSLSQLVSIWVNDVHIFDGRTNAERSSTDIFDAEFRFCMDKTRKDIELDLKAYSFLTAAQGQIWLQPGTKRGIKAMVQWERDIYGVDVDPNTTPVPIFNNADLIYRYKTT